MAKLIERFRIDDRKKFRLGSFDCADTCGLDLDKDEAKAILAEDLKRLSKQQELLYAQDRWAVLVVFQGMDTAGKDGVIKHVMGAINPQGCEVHPFKAPSDQELDHDFLWRAGMRLPERGRFGIFNRSYYEEVIVVRVHDEMLGRQKLPREVVTKHIWEERFEDIVAFERHLARSGTLVLKFFLHVSRDEQARRLLDRLDDPAKRWKFSKGDIVERKLWDQYMDVYEEMLAATSRKHAPWYVVPADNKPFARLLVAKAVVEALEQLDLTLPTVEGPALKELEEVRKALLSEMKDAGGKNSRKGGKRAKG
jgi:PPK2 family polyphosphate:nucleotide phosphotransferase